MNKNNALLIAAAATAIIVTGAVMSVDEWLNEPIGPGSGEVVEQEEPTGPGSGDVVEQ